jgi:hypothetical protein
MEHQVKMELRPLSARSQVKAGPWIGVTYRYASKPIAEVTAMEMIGRPLRSTYAKSLGAWPCSARAWRVRVAPYMEEFATERTAIRTTAFMTESRPEIPALRMATIKGEAFESTEDEEMS